jgi:hypothetical protein
VRAQGQQDHLVVVVAQVVFVQLLLLQGVGVVLKHLYLLLLVLLTQSLLVVVERLTQMGATHFFLLSLL